MSTDTILRPGLRKAGGGVATLLILGVMALPAQAQSINDRLQQIQGAIAQLHTSLNTFAADTLTRLSSISERLTTIADRLAPPATPAALSTGYDFKPDLHFSECRVVNVGTTQGNVRLRLMRRDGVELAASTNTLSPSQGTTISEILTAPSAAVWCRFEPQSPGMELRASLNISPPGGTSIVVREAR
jgi:hypothetical protein